MVPQRLCYHRLLGNKALSRLGPAAPIVTLCVLLRGSQLQVATATCSHTCCCPPPPPGAFIIRRLVGIAHTADMDSISDPDSRAACELRALRFGRHLLVEGPNTYRDIRALAAAVAAARQVDGLTADTEAAGVNGVAASAEAAAL